MRHLLGIIVVAVTIAAVLRHTFHVHLGLSREQIREEALIAAAAVVTLLIVGRYVSRRWRKRK
jgi:hypothetical protein